MEPATLELLGQHANHCATAAINDCQKLLIGLELHVVGKKCLA